MIKFKHKARKGEKSNWVTLNKRKTIMIKYLPNTK